MPLRGDTSALIFNAIWKALPFDQEAVSPEQIESLRRGASEFELK
jgi:hypothetical protein